MERAADLFSDDIPSCVASWVAARFSIVRLGSFKYTGFSSFPDSGDSSVSFGFVEIILFIGE